MNTYIAIELELGLLVPGSLDSLRYPVSLAPKDGYKWAFLACSQNVLLSLIASSSSWLRKGQYPQDAGSTCKYLLPPACGELPSFKKQSPRIRKEKGKPSEWQGFY